MKMHPMLN